MLFNSFSIAFLARLFVLDDHFSQTCFLTNYLDKTNGLPAPCIKTEHEDTKTLRSSLCHGWSRLWESCPELSSFFYKKCQIVSHLLFHRFYIMYACSRMIYFMVKNKNSFDFLINCVFRTLLRQTILIFCPFFNLNQE